MAPARCIGEVHAIDLQHWLSQSFDMLLHTDGWQVQMKELAAKVVTFVLRSSLVTCTARLRGLWMAPATWFRD